MKQKKALIEKFKGLEIFLDKETERFVCEDKKRKLKFEASSLWDIKGDIMRSREETIDRVVFIKSGYWGRAIQKVKLLTINKPLEQMRYEVLEDTENTYDIGKIQTKELSDCKFYELTEHNKLIFDNVKNLQKDIGNIEKEQEKEVDRIK